MTRRKRKGASLHAPIPVTKCTRNLTPAPTGAKLISYWPNGAGVTRIQTRCPSIARELRRLKATHQVGESIAGGYLRLFHSTQRLGLRKTLKRIESASRRTFLSEEGLRKSLASAPDGAGRYPHPPGDKGSSKGVLSCVGNINIRGGVG
jgi:hypothetical protein